MCEEGFSDQTSKKIAGNSGLGYIHEIICELTWTVYVLLDVCFEISNFSTFGWTYTPVGPVVKKMVSNGFKDGFKR